MRKPNDLAQKVLSQAADEYAKLADQYEMLSDASRRYAIALRDGDIDKIVTANEEIESSDKLDTADGVKRAVEFIKTIPSLDSEWFNEIYIKTQSRLIEKMGYDQVMLALLLHASGCNKSACNIHDMLAKRLDALR